MFNDLLAIATNRRLIYSYWANTAFFVARVVSCRRSSHKDHVSEQ